MSDDTVRAGEYVLGVLSPEERVAVERDAAAHPELAAEIAFWSEHLMPLLDGVAVEPPAELFGRIMTSIAESLPGTVTVRGGEGEWHRFARGLDRKILHRAPNGRVTYLLRGQPGARLSAHEHDGDEEIYVLEGDITIGTLTLQSGDYHLARRGFRHPVATSAKGCLLLVSAAA